MRKRILTLFFVLALLLSTSTVAFAASPKEFNETNFEGMVVSYTDAGYPVVDDPSAVIENIEARGVVTATTINDTWAYSDMRLNNDLFIIPAGRAVVVLQTNTNYGSAEISYAGTTVWVSSSNLRLGE